MSHLWWKPSPIKLAIDHEGTIYPIKQDLSVQTKLREPKLQLRAEGDPGIYSSMLALSTPDWTILWQLAFVLLLQYMGGKSTKTT